MTSDHDLGELAAAAKAWPFREAGRVAARLTPKGGDGPVAPDKGYVLFETGYGPSGLPHIGTFAEVVRTTMVRRAFEAVSDVPTKLFTFSDDMDGMRSIPDNIPNKEMLAEHMGKPLTSVPDPFGEADSFGAHNNARLRAFLDTFGFDYEFFSATICYRSGMFDATLLDLLAKVEEVKAVILPTLGEERRATYNPFLPVCPRTGRVLQVPILETDAGAGTLAYDDPETGERVETPVTGGRCKLQWKADWAMRWTALAVDYEMAGKDLIDSVKLSGRIARILGATPPENLIYEMFLDENGEKISKSRGNGLTMEEWLTYGPRESLAYYMYHKPKTAKRLTFGVIPRSVDEYLGRLAGFGEESPDARLENPVWHVHKGAPPQAETGVSFALLLNLVGVANTDDPDVLWGFISRYQPGVGPETHPFLARLVTHAIAYYRDFVLPAKSYRAPSDRERAAIEALIAAFEALPQEADGEAIQAEVYRIGKEAGFEPLRDWFKALYEILFGQSQGPRFGSFAALYGLPETVALLRAG
ncbi:MAG: lysine--tRNA ligase, partial [Alphaproteobacteria bacterium]|nr:lysine--tRNA ligase [Alphaproteobacteria bacterium]